MMKHPILKIKKKNAGFTIVESMITGVLILIVIAGLSSLYLGVKRGQINVANVSDARGIALKIIHQIYSRPSDYAVIIDSAVSDPGWKSTYVGCYSKAGEFRAVGVGYSDHYSVKDFVIYRVVNNDLLVTGANSSGGQTACNYKDGYEVHIQTVIGVYGSSPASPDTNLHVTIIPLANLTQAQSGNAKISNVKFSVPVSSPMSPGIYVNM